MKNIIIFALFSILLFQSCSKQNSISSELRSLEKFGYFPLHVGNMWEFSDGSTTTIDSMITLDGKEYYRFIRAKSSSTKQVFYRQDDNKIFERKENRPEVLKFILDSDVNEEWEVSKEGQRPATIGNLKNKKARVNTDNFIFKKCLQFHIDNPGVADDARDIFLFKGIGLIRSIGEWTLPSYPSLTRVVIGGQEVIFE